MSETVNRDGFPKTGNYLQFLKMFTSLDKTRWKNVFISPGELAGSFNYCCFPSAVSLPAEFQRYLKVAEAVADIMTDSNSNSSPTQKLS